MKALIKTPMSHIKVPGFDAVFLMAVSCYCRPWEATVMAQVTFSFFLQGGRVSYHPFSGLGLCSWVLTSGLGQPWSLWDVVSIEGVGCWMGSLSLAVPLPLSFSQMNLRIIYIFWGPIRCFNICINCDVQCKHIHLIFFIIQSIKILSSSF